MLIGIGPGRKGMEERCRPGLREGKGILKGEEARILPDQAKAVRG